MTSPNDPIPLIVRDDEAAGSGNLVAANVAALRTLFPEVVTDGKVDFDVLRELLGEALEESEERYGLNWKGKRRARAFALTPSLGTLLPSEKESVNWDETQNIFVEGDNLEVLKVLRRSYAGRIKLIYIDPPYNTGNDFVYPDNYKNSLGNYLNLTGQSGGDGEILTSDREISGRFHTNWLNMIYPRLALAKEFLSDDGVIAISIDDGEVSSLQKILQEIFGESNNVSTLIWKSRQNKDNRPEKGVSNDHEFILVYGGSFRGEERKIDQYSNNDGDERGPWVSANMVGLATADRRPNLHYPLIDPATGIDYGCPELGWRYDRNSMAKLIAESRILWPADSKGRPRRKAFLSELTSDYTGVGSIFGEGLFTRHGTADIAKLFDKRVFDFPKPVDLITRLIEQSASDTDIVMDFFAGSGTTGHAVMARNAATGSKLRHIAVQLPEPLDDGDPDQKTAAVFLDSINKPRNIAELTKERLRRAGKKIREEHPNANVDTGFRAYKLATSNLKPWQPDADDLEASILDAVDNVLPGRTQDDLLVELLLKTGIDLTLPEEKRSIAGQTVHALGGGTLIVCLGDVGADDTEALGQGMADWVDALDPVQTTVYFKDTGLGANGNRAATKANLAAILRQRLGDRIAKIASI